MANMIIYALSHPITGEVRYIGKSERGLRRPREHKRLAYGKRTGKFPVSNWIKKLHIQNLDYVIEIVEECQDRKALMEAEKFYISYFRFLGFKLLNICDGGEGFTGKHTKESKAKIAESSKSRKHTEESKRKLSEAHKGKKLSEEHRQKMRKPKGGLGAKGNKRLSEESKRKLSESLKGRKLSPEHVIKIAKSKGAKPIIDNFGNIFQTQIEAARFYKIDQGAIRQILTGKGIQTNGATFAYLDSLPAGTLPKIRERVSLKGIPKSEETKRKIKEAKNKWV